MTNGTTLYAADLPEPLDAAEWGDSGKWLASTDGDAATDQPRTQAELERSGEFFGPFESEHEACKWLMAYAQIGE